MLTDIHEEALREFDAVQSALRDERLQCLNDRRFYSIAGAQWEGNLGLQFKNKPMLEVNKVHLSVMRIINEYRNNTITVDFVSKNGDPVNEKLADTLDGLYRSDEHDSGADEAYDNAFEEAVGGGIGAWRLRTVYDDPNDPDSDFQRISIEPIYDADSCVFFDLGSKRQDKADAKKCFVIIAMTPDDFKERWPDASPAEVQKEVDESGFDWTGQDVVHVAEYYRVTEKDETVNVYVDMMGDEHRYTEDELDDELVKKLAAIGTTKVRSKTIKKKTVHKYIINGQEIIEDLGLIAGEHIPIVMTYGKRWIVDNIERAMGHVRLSKDAQRLKNMQISKLAEISAYSTIEKPIMTPEQVLGHEHLWREDTIENYAYLLVNATLDKDGAVSTVGPTSYTKSPQIPPAMAALLQLTEEDLSQMLGKQESGEEIATNLSGRAVELVQNRLDMQSYIYLSNMAKAMRRSGEIWLSMAKEVFVEGGREVKLIGKQNQSSSVELNKPIMVAGNEELENDIGNAKFTLMVDVGPSSNSRRASTVRSLTSVMAINQDPETAQVLSAMTMMNMEGEGVEDVRTYFRGKLLRMGVVKPTDQEAKQLEEEAKNAEPDPNTQYLRAAAMNEVARASKARADTAKALAGTNKLNAETMEILAEIDRTERQTALENLQLLIPQATTQPQQSENGQQ